MKRILKALFVVFSIGASSDIFPRSYLRPQDPDKQTLIAAWESHDGNSYEIKSNYLEEYPLFVIRADNLTNDLIPEGPVTFRDGSGNVNGKELGYLIDELVREIKAKQKKFTHFTVLQSKNFNYREQCGLLVLKFNDYPFVVKLFMETPETFVNPYIKGPEPVFFWYMGGGSGRHIAGLTRVKNLKLMQEQITLHPYWHDHLVTPRKWFWLPKNTPWITLKGTNIKPNKTISNSIPGTYAIIADAIDTTDSYKLAPREQRKMVMQFCNDMGLSVDPHAKNFIFHKHPTKDEPIMALVDTEHFPTIVGLKDEKEFESHGQWYRFLVNKGFNDIYMRTKKDRNEALAKEHKLALIEAA